MEKFTYISGEKEEGLSHDAGGINPIMILITTDQPKEFELTSTIDGELPKVMLPKYYIKVYRQSPFFVSMLNTHTYDQMAICLLLQKPPTSLHINRVTHHFIEF